MSSKSVTLQPTKFEMTRQGVRNLDNIRGGFVPATFTKESSAPSGKNVSEAERALSLVGGAALLGAGLSIRAVAGLVMGFIGGALIYRGVTGHCQSYQALGINTAKRTCDSTEMAYREQ